MSFQSAPILAITGFVTIGVGLLVLLFGYQQAKAKNFRNHRNLMLVAAGVNGAFLVQYISRFAMGEHTVFGGPDIVRYLLYLPILVIHIAGAIITIVLVIIHLKRSLSNQNLTNQGIPYFDKEYRQDHRSFGRITFYLWVASFVGGITIFFFLYIFY